MSKDELTLLSDGVKTLLDKSGLAAKGVSFIEYTRDSAKQVADLLRINAPKILPYRLKELLIRGPLNMLEVGKNAFFAPKGNKIVIPTGGKFSLAYFHEIGHAMNANFSTVGKILQKMRPLTMLVLPIALLSLLKTKKAEGEQPQGIWDKTTTFIKNHAGKLTFAAFLPVLVEEGLASIKGQKLAKSILSPELLAKVSKNNKLAYLTYLGLALASALGVALAVKIKDKIAHRKPIEDKATVKA
ncbi:MAG: hypothetical protein PHX18_00555 [Candidatus Gastranaerophilales bacterium]|nr:hypothetical protein [Candidatus Gastranaerophilales bacterium]